MEDPKFQLFKVESDPDVKLDEVVEENSLLKQLINELFIELSGRSPKCYGHDAEHERQFKALYNIWRPLNKPCPICRKLMAAPPPPHVWGNIASPALRKDGCPNGQKKTKNATWILAMETYANEDENVAPLLDIYLHGTGSPTLERFMQLLALVKSGESITCLSNPYMPVA